MNPNITFIRVENRLGFNLSRLDKEDIKRCLLNYCLDNELSASDVVPDENLAIELIPRFAEINEEWTTLSNSKLLEGTALLKDFKSHLRNQFREQGKYLNKKIESELQIRSE